MFSGEYEEWGEPSISSDDPTERRNYFSPPKQKTVGIPGRAGPYQTLAKALGIGIKALSKKKKKTPVMFGTGISGAGAGADTLANFQGLGADEDNDAGTRANTSVADAAHWQGLGLDEDNDAQISTIATAAAAAQSGSLESRSTVAKPTGARGAEEELTSR